MSRVIDCGNIQVDVEQTSKDLALIFAKTKLQERIRDTGGLSNKDEETTALTSLTENYYSALAYLMTVPEEKIIELMEV